MTSLPPFLPEPPAPSTLAGAFGSGGAAPTAPAGGGAGSDFAGLLDAAASAAPASGTGTSGAPPVPALPSPGPSLPGPSSPPAASTAASLIPVLAPEPVTAPTAPRVAAGGNFLPETGAQLPPGLPLADSVPERGVPTSPLAEPDLLDERQAAAPRPVAPDGTGTGSGPVPSAPLLAALPAPIAPATPEAGTSAAERPDDAEAQAEALAAPPLVLAGLPMAAAAAPAAALPPLPDADPAGCADQPRGSAMAVPGLVPTAPSPAAVPELQTAATGPAKTAAGAIPGAIATAAPARTALPRDGAKGAAEPAPAPAAPAPLPTGESTDAAAAASAASATSTATAAPAPMPAVIAAPDALPPATGPALAADRSAEPLPLSTGLGAAPGARGEAAIDQVGALREALRSAQPAMTLRHAEFGTIALRIEQPAPDQWRAVLASRDPGFVPAIHAALAERALAPAAASDTGFSGQPQHGASHTGTGDQRYGASPNGGQGGSQPYLGQSGSRDGEAAPDHRRPSTAAALAALGASEAEDPASPASTKGGLFA